ncbi:MAG: SdrD B-like domain-containing protein, partial [Litorilinea sp.]
ENSGVLVGMPADASPEACTLNAWIDFNGDGDFFGVSEQIATDQTLAAGSGNTPLKFTVPSDAIIGDTYARFRCSTESGLSPTGPAVDGEVEDYRVTIGAPETLCLGNLVFNDSANNGLFDPSDDFGINDVLVSLYNDVDGDGVRTPADGAAIQTTTTSDGGFYQFCNLPPDDYIVELDSSNFEPSGGVLERFSSSLSRPGTESDTIIDPDNNVDNDDNGIQQQSPKRVSSQAVTLALGDEPTDDGDADANTNLTIDFGLYNAGIGDLVFSDNDGDGIYEPGDGEAGIEDVLLNLYRDDGDTPGVFDPGDTLLLTTTTGSEGLYTFPFLQPGEYIVQVDEDNFNPSQPLAGLVSSPGAPDPNNDVNNDDNGAPLPSPLNGVAGAPLTLTSGGEPTDDGDGDEFTNLTYDFGFMPLLTLGNRVWLDNGSGGSMADNGAMDGDEPGIGGVVLRLLDGAGNPVLDGDGQAIATTTTANGCYLFNGLLSGDYIVEVVAENFQDNQPLANLTSSRGNSTNGNAPDPDSDMDMDDNGNDSLVNGSVRSGVVIISLGDEPTGEADANIAGCSSSAFDENSNLTVDFGFFQLPTAEEPTEQPTTDTRSIFLPQINLRTDQ